MLSTIPCQSRSARTHLILASALAGTSSAMLLAMPSAAWAQEECGAAPATPGTVTCAPAGNPYPNGVTYIVPPADLTIVLQDGVRIDTSNGLDLGLLVVGDSAFTVEGGTNTIITSDSFGALISNNVNPISVTLDQIITTGTNSFGLIASSSEGAITLSTNAITTNGDNASGVSASTDTSAITIRSGSITTGGVNAVGIDANSDGGYLDITSGTVRTTDVGGGGFFGGAVGILAQTGGIGTVTVNSANISTAGTDAFGIRAQSDTGALSVTSAVINTTGFNADGINVSTAGNATINGGAITTTGANADGIVASAVTGATIAFTSIETSGANANGVLVPAGVQFFGPRATATVAVNGGSISTIGATSDGIRAIAGTGTSTVNVTGNITTQGDNSRGIFATGPTGVSVTNTGTISTSGMGSNGVDASSTVGPVNVTVNNVRTTGDGSQAVVVNSTSGDATATVNGELRTTGITADVLTVSSGGNSVVNVGADGSFIATQGNSIVLNSVGTSTLNNAGTIANNANGFALIVTGGPVTINNSGNLSSDIMLTDGADRINNSGTLTVGVNPDFGAGTDSFVNSGLILVGAGAGAAVSPTFTGLENLNNSGTIDLRNGRAGDTLTLPGAYTGANGTLGLDITLGATPVADQLIVAGSATGTTTIQLNPLAGSQPMFNSGTVLVRAATTSDANAFDLAGGSVSSGFVRLEVVFNPATGTYSLTGAPSDSAFRTLNFNEGVRSLWLKSADAVAGQLRARRDALWTQGGGDVAGRFWMQMHGSVETRGGSRDFNTFGQSRQTTTGYQQDYFGGQLGFDVSGASGERGGFAFGVTGGYINSSMNFAGSADRLRFDVVNGGVYGSFTSGNVFINALGKYDYYWANSTMPTARFQDDINGGVYGARAEAGVRVGSDSFFIEPAASISYVRSDFDDLALNGTTIGFDDDDGLRGRAGGRIGGTFAVGGGAEAAFYVGGNYVHEFKGRDRVVFTSGGQTLGFTNTRLRDYGEATLGVTIAQSQGISGFIEGNYIRSFSDRNGIRGIDGAGGRAGIRVRF